MFSAVNGDRDDADNVVIIVTDGYSTMDKNLTLPEAEIAREKVRERERENRRGRNRATNLL